MTSTTIARADRRASYKSKTRRQIANAKAAIRGRSRLESAPTERGNRRRSLLVQAATEEFLDKGFEGASLREILRRAGGSSDTLYKLFGDKGGLFVACAINLCGQFMVTFELGAPGRGVEQELVEFGITFMQDLLSPKMIGIQRMMIAEVKRFPGLGQIVLDVGHDRMTKLLADYLSEQVKAGVLEIENCGLAALQFTDMIHGGYHWRPLLLTGPSPSAAEIAECVRTAARVFCKGYAKT